MARIVSVRLLPTGKACSFDPKELDVHRCDVVVVDTEGGLELGRVVSEPKEIDAGELKKRAVRPMLRKADPDDLERRAELEVQEEDALALAKDRARELGLPMKFVGAHYAMDGSRVFLFFGAGERVDFRQLLRQLSESLRVRVELRHMGARDEAKLAGGLGRCGRLICCAGWLTEFFPVTIRMAKDQSLPISAEGLAGQCGRLRCCLRYECQQYQAINKKLPRLNQMVETPRGRGRVLTGHPVKETVSVVFEEGEVREFPLDQVTRLEGPRRRT